MRARVAVFYRDGCVPSSLVLVLTWESSTDDDVAVGWVGIKDEVMVWRDLQTTKQGNVKHQDWVVIISANIWPFCTLNMHTTLIMSAVWTELKN